MCFKCNAVLAIQTFSAYKRMALPNLGCNCSLLNLSNPHFSPTLWLQSLESLSNKGLTPLKAMRKNQHPVETLTSQDFDQTKIIAFQAFFVRNAGNVSETKLSKNLSFIYLYFTVGTATPKKHLPIYPPTTGLIVPDFRFPPSSTDRGIIPRSPD